MKGLIVAGIAGLVGIGGVIGASAAMEPASDPVALTAAAPNTAAALEDRISRLANARRAVDNSRRSSTTRTTITVEDRVAAPSHHRRGRGSDDAFEGNADDDRGGDRVRDRDDDRDDDDSRHGRNRGRGGDDD
jgi:hypothetical protein